jgi:hypothetical protein
MVTKVKFSADIFLLRGVLSPQECEDHIASAEARGFDSAPITTAAGFDYRPEIRNNSRVIVDDPLLADSIWARIADFIPEALDGRVVVGLNERFRYYRYDPSQRFATHSDGYYERSNGERSLLTFMIYLNSGFGGGATVFDLTTIRPQVGLGLVFRHALVHEGAVVTRGRKYVLRSDVMYDAPSHSGG